MAYLQCFRVMVLAYTSLLVTLLLATLVSGSICPEKQYLNSRQQVCVNCTECKDGSVVLRPCEIHRDTRCGPIGELLKSMESGNHHRHHHQQNYAEPKENTEWEFKDNIKSEVHQEHVTTLEVASSEAPFSSAETIVWDWQAIALTAAVFTCILFFLVIALYSLHQAKQWKRLKENFEADVEELSARLGLMAATAATATNEKGEILKTDEIGSSSIRDTNYLNNRCVYLEQSLNVWNGYKIRTLPKGNVYIEESNSKT